MTLKTPQTVLLLPKTAKAPEFPLSGPRNCLLFENISFRSWVLPLFAPTEMGISFAMSRMLSNQGVIVFLEL